MVYWAKYGDVVMPFKALKPCAHPGCAALVSGGYCPKHRAVSTPLHTEKEREKHRLYGRRWKHMRDAQLARQPWCEECLRANIYEPAVHVHHEERHQGDVERFHRSRLVSLCHSCHSKITATEVGVNARGRGGQNV